jgi:tetratricopeptide (TPR) repeat protein
MPQAYHIQLAKRAIQLAKNQEFEEAILVNHECLKAKKAIKDYEGMAFCYDRLSGIYWRLHKCETQQDQKLKHAHDSFLAADYSLDYGEHTFNRIRSFMKAAEVYAQQQLHHQKLDEAEKLFKESLSYNVTAKKILNLEGYIFCHSRLMYIYAKKAWQNLEQEKPLKETLQFFHHAFQSGCNIERYLSNKADKEQLVLLSKFTHDYAKCLEENGEYEAAIEKLEFNLRLNHKMNDYKNKNLTLDKLASLHFHQGDLKKAKNLFQQVIIEKNIQDKIVYDHSRHVLATIYDKLGETAMRNNKFEKAKYYYENSLQLSKMNNDIRKTSEAEVRLAFFFVRSSDYDQSHSCFEKGIGTYLNFLSQREKFDFKGVLSEDAKKALEHAQHWGEQHQSKKASLCYASVWNEIMEKSKNLLASSQPSSAPSQHVSKETNQC